MGQLYVVDGYIASGYIQSGITIDWKNRIIYIPRFALFQVQSSPTAIYELDLNAFRLKLKELEASEDGMIYPHTHEHNKPVTVGGVTLARVIEIVNSYTITFENGQYAVNLIGGNSNIADKVNVNGVSVRSANSAGLVELKEMIEGVAATKRMIEALRSSHSGYGAIYYWDPVAGNDTNDGLTPEKACKTFKYIHDNLVEDWGHDIIFAMPGSSNSSTVSYENLVIYKNYVFLRGPGRDFLISSANNALNNITITGEGVQVAKLRVGENPSNTMHAIWCSGSFVSLEHIVVRNTNKGVELTGVARAYMHNLDVQDNIGYGFKVAGASTHVYVKDSHFGDNGGTGILIDNVGGDDIVIHNEVMSHGNGGYGIHITPGSGGVVLHSDVNIFNNTLGNIYDQGLNTYNEATLADMAVAHAVWDEPATDHSFGGSFSALVRDATPGNIATAVRTNLATELSKINSQINGLTTPQLTMLTSMYELLGLDPTKPLVVTPTTIDVGTIHQNIIGNDTMTTVTRV